MDNDKTQFKDSNENNASVAHEAGLLPRRKKNDYIFDVTSHDQYCLTFDPYEAMLLSLTYDSVSRETRSGMTDGSLTNLALEQSRRVVGQMPTGEVKAAGKKDAGKSSLLDLIRTEYIYKNANAQFPFLQKIQMWDFYAHPYGYMPMFVDWHVAPTGYVGPDCWLWNPRNFIPQNGCNSIADMDYCHAVSYITPAYIEDILDALGVDYPDADEGVASEYDDNEVTTKDSGVNESGWNVKYLLEFLKFAREYSLWNDNTRDTYVKRNRQYQAIHGQIPLVTRYEAGKDGHWVTFCPVWGYKVLRDIENPHKTGRIPFFIKSYIPLFDSFYGLGSFQRGKPLQFAKDGLLNFYFEGLKMNIYPPVIVNANGVVRHTIDMSPGSVWQETIDNSVRRLETSTAGLNTYQAATNQLSASLQAQFGSTQTTLNAEAAMDPQFGKTPQALQMLASKENVNDNFDRRILEMVLEDMIDYMLQLIINVGTEAIDLNIFSQEIQDLVASGYTDVLEMLEIGGKTVKQWLDSGQEPPKTDSAKLRIKPSIFKDLQVRFHIKEGTTKAEDNADKLQAVLDWLKNIGPLQNELQTIRDQSHKEIDWELIATMVGQYGNVPQMNKVFRDITPQEQAAEVQQENQEAQAQAVNPTTPRISFQVQGKADDQQTAEMIQAGGISGAPQPPAGGAPAAIPTGSPGIPTMGGAQLSPEGHAAMSKILAMAGGGR